MTKNKNLVLELNTDPDIIRYTHLQNATAWKSKLTAEQYADREWHIGCESKIGKRDEENNTGLYHFSLRDLTLPNDSKVSNIVASCETMNRKGWKISPNGELKEVVAPCIGGVYTNPEYRGKGYAAEMIKSLNQYWDEKLDKDSFMFLYSEVGPYYEKFGYKDLEVPLHEIAIPATYEPTVDSTKFHYLKYEEYGKLVDYHYKTVKEDLIAKSKKTNKVLYSLIPHLDIYSWFHDRDLFISKTLRPELKIKHFGVMSNDGSMDHVIWLHDWNGHNMTVINISASTPENFEELFQCVVKEARLYNMHHIDIWDSSIGAKGFYEQGLDYIQKNFSKGSKFFQKNGSVSSIRGLDGTGFEGFSWENNQKWCWF